MAYTPVPQPALAATGHMPVLERIRRLLQPPAPALAVSPWPVAAVVLLASMLLLAAPQSKAQIKPSRGRIMDRNGLVLAESDAEGVRRYPYQSLAAHIIGYTGLRQLRSKELAGRSGIELAEDKALFAKADVLLTLDARLQQIAESTLINAGWHGACVVIDPNNGDILAMASVPGYDLNSFIPLSPAHFEPLIKDPGVPMRQDVLYPETP